MRKRLCQTCQRETEHYWKHGSGLEAVLTCEECEVVEKPKEFAKSLPMVVFKGNGFSKVSLTQEGGRRAIIDRQTGETLTSRKEFSFKNYD